MAYGAGSPAQRRRNHSAWRARSSGRTAPTSMPPARRSPRTTRPGRGARRSTGTSAPPTPPSVATTPRAPRALSVHRACGSPGEPELEARELEILTALPGPLMAPEGYASPRLAESRTTRSAGAPRRAPPAPLVRALALAVLSRDDFDAALAYGEQLCAGARRRRRRARGRGRLGPRGGGVLAGPARAGAGALRGRARSLAAGEPRGAPARVRTGYPAACLVRLAHILCLWATGRGAPAATPRERARRGASLQPRAVLLFAALLELDQARRAAALPRRRADRARVEGRRSLFAEAMAGYLDVLDGSRPGCGLDHVRRRVFDRDLGCPPLPAAGCPPRAGVRAHGRGPRDGPAAARWPEGNGAQPWAAGIRSPGATFLDALDAPRAEVEAELRRAVEAAEDRARRRSRRRGTLRGTLGKRLTRHPGAHDEHTGSHYRCRPA